MNNESHEDQLDPGSFPEPARRRRWLGLPVCQSVERRLPDILNELPHFGRQPFTMVSVNGSEIAINPYLDMIYRAPIRQGDTPVPVGIVSKNYRLVDHHQVLTTIGDIVADFGIAASELRVTAEWTLYGERARFSIILPAESRFTLRLGEGDEMRFRIEIFNSVEGSCRLMAVAGWLRFVCSNGLILGTALMQLRQQHRQQLQMEEMGRLLRDALQAAGDDIATMKKWLSTPIGTLALTDWADNDLNGKWGQKAATRVLAIVMTGRDADLKGDLKNKRPSEVSIRSIAQVPGFSAPVGDAFGVSQALTWIAGQRTEIQEELEWRTEVPELMELLINTKNLTSVRY